MFSILLLLSIIAIASATSETRFLVSVKETLSHETQPLYNQIASAFDIRATLPTATIFVATSEEQIKLSTLLGEVTIISEFSEAIDYHIVFGEIASLQLQSVFGKGVIAINDKAMMLMSPKFLPLEALEALVDPHEDIVSRFTLPSYKLKPVRKSKIPTTERVYIPEIQALVDAVDAGNMEITLDRLAYDFGTPNSRNSNADGLDEAQLWVSSVFQSYNLTVTTHRHQSSHALNTIGTLYGASRDQFVVIGAHLDSRNTGSNDVSNPAPGADDNGSGSVALLELARIITSSGIRFQYSIQFCLWTGEEQGLLGSRSYASEQADNNVDVIAYINADMIGYRVNQASVLSLMSGSASRVLNEYIEDVVAVYVPGLEVSRTNACCSDQQSYYENGYESAGFFEHEGGAGSYPCYHQQCDTPSQIDFEMLEDNAKAFMAATADLAIPLV